MARFYLHGLPGGPGELAGFAPRDHGMVALERLGPGSYERRLAMLAYGLPHGAELTGFSLGAMTALRLAALVPDKVARLRLIAPGAPLSLGNFLPDMAGGPVFRAAIAGTLPLFALTQLQRAAIEIAPAPFFNGLMRSAPETERALLSEPGRRALLAASWRQALGQGRAMRDELRAYVADWSGALAAVRAPVELWMGEADDWVPPAMAEALAAQLGARVTRVPGVGHYGTLAAALSEA